MSAYPLAATRQLDTARFKMAMAVTGKNRHYRWQEIQGRHWMSTAKKCRFPQEEARVLLDGCAERVESIVDEVRQTLPPDFPETVAQPIFEGLLAAGERVRAA
jgi:serine/threonine-protein kinase HipA